MASSDHERLASSAARPSTSEEDAGAGAGALEPRGDLEITIDERSRGDWRSVILRARKHLHCVPHTPGRCAEVDYYDSISPRVNKATYEAGDGSRGDASFPVFPQLPKELRDKILLLSVDPLMIEGWVRVDREWNHGPQVRFSSDAIRSWRDVPLYAVSRETRALACGAFGAPDPLGFPFSPARDVVSVIWDGGTLWAGHRFLGDVRDAGPVIASGTTRTGRRGREWVMPEGLRARVREVSVDGLFGVFGQEKKGRWGLVFGILGWFAELRVLEVLLWDADDGRFEGVWDCGREELYRIDQLDFLDELEEMAGDGVVPFPKMEMLRVKCVLATEEQRRKGKFTFRKVNGSHFLVVKKGEYPTAGP
ncbi:hypothetical protein CkaCkLH20_13209 [Colletotrichum karsti]|uniref:2EXR domain-containing protein n=1 Tax=Colletotrichum karsti TaxID=1095194 RepID=A0A9P6HRV4_9PEZI|nr:uncharacterized protein CkaCkLH20_13209 [Colletotrichum karsti]KAF9869292.1 hypothetical protein CkaCkLH20_13209 [Colletotrichum karsti]